MYRAWIIFLFRPKNTLGVESDRIILLGKAETLNKAFERKYGEVSVGGIYSWTQRVRYNEKQGAAKLGSGGRSGEAEKG